MHCNDHVARVKADIFVKRRTRQKLDGRVGVFKKHTGSDQPVGRRAHGLATHLAAEVYLNRGLDCTVELECKIQLFPLMIHDRAAAFNAVAQIHRACRLRILNIYAPGDIDRLACGRHFVGKALAKVIVDNGFGSGSTCGDERLPERVGAGVGAAVCNQMKSNVGHNDRHVVAHIDLLKKNI